MDASLDREGKWGYHDDGVTPMFFANITVCAVWLSIHQCGTAGGY